MLALHPSTTRLSRRRRSLYASEVVHAGFADNLVQQYVHREGHCAFSPDEVGRAFDELVVWAHTGKPPQAGLLR